MQIFSKRRPPGRPTYPDVLTPAEWRVLDQLRAGCTNQEIAQRLGVSQSTVKTHVSSMLAKLRMEHRHQLAAWRGEPMTPEQIQRRSLLLAPLGWLASQGTGIAVATVVVASLGAFFVAMQSGILTGDDAALPATETTSTVTAPPVEATPTAPSEPREVPPLAELYRPEAYAPPEFGLGSRPLPTRSPPPTLEAANVEAAVFLADAYPQPEDPAAFEGVPGIRERQCFDTTAEAGTRFRSGDFVLDTLNYRDPNYDFALQAQSEAERLFIRATYLDAEDATDPPTMLHEYSRYTSPLEEWHPTLVLPEEGRWLVVMTAGPQWGCFVIDAPPPEPHYTPARTVAEAERNGAEYRLPNPSPHVSPAFSMERGPDVTAEHGWSLRGGPQRVCIDTSDAHDARSGEWVMRPTSGLFQQPAHPSGNKFLLIPRTQPATVEELDAWAGFVTLAIRLTGTYLDAPQHTYVFEARSPNAYTPPSLGYPGFEFQHITGAVLPRIGPWVVVVTDGAGGGQWGCFVSPGYGNPYPYGTD